MNNITRSINDIKIIIDPTINRDKANKWFKKYFLRLKVDRKDIYINTIIIKNNSNYKIFNPRKPFKGKNPKFECVGINQNLMNLNLVHDINF